MSPVVCRGGPGRSWDFLDNEHTFVSPISLVHTRVRRVLCKLYLPWFIHLWPSFGKGLCCGQADFMSSPAPLLNGCVILDKLANLSKLAFPRKIEWLTQSRKITQKVWYQVKDDCIPFLNHMGTLSSPRPTQSLFNSLWDILLFFFLLTKAQILWSYTLTCGFPKLAKIASEVLVLCPTWH